MSGLTYYCWYCYTGTENSTGPCPVCGRPVEGPPGLDYTDRLMWTLHHPLPERRIVAAQVLGARRDPRAAQPLRQLLDEGPDPYLAVAAVEALVQLTGVDANRRLLREYADNGPAPVRRVARDLLARSAARRTHGHSREQT